MFGDLDDLFNENKDHKKINVQLLWADCIIREWKFMQAIRCPSFDGRLSKSYTLEIHIF